MFTKKSSVFKPEVVCVYRFRYRYSTQQFWCLGFLFSSPALVLPIFVSQITILHSSPGEKLWIMTNHLYDWGRRQTRWCCAMLCKGSTAASQDPSPKIYFRKYKPTWLGKDIRLSHQRAWLYLINQARRRAKQGVAREPLFPFHLAAGCWLARKATCYENVRSY